MGKYKYSEEQQQMNNVLKYHDDQLGELLTESRENRNAVEAEIEVLEALLRKRGIEPGKAAKEPVNVDVPKKVLVYPSWERMCKEAEAAVGNNCELESIFTEEELKSNELALKQLRADYNQIHRLDKVDIAISAIAGIVGAAVLYGMLMLVLTFALGLIIVSTMRKKWRIVRD